MPQTMIPKLMAATAQIVSAHVSHNAMAKADLVGLIERVHGALAGISASPIETLEAPVPAVPIRKSVTPDFIICLEDGKKLKMLKRHLMAAFQLTPSAYRARWGLPPDYPMVAPNYARRRSAMAREAGLGGRAAAEG